MAGYSSQHRMIIDNVNPFNVSNNYHSRFNVNAGIEGERRQILEWLSPLEPQQRRHSV
ncbi:hypothetical protein L873DRAFT_1810682 [Choiromyces venosus 120613-1]|uniref:Uncharacterized protein n=1 Tax=Choiromyces venosus 120613-1 TaxID=1336337 RepID=A0A3N4JF72_9PEZI|nr:hypothetical protein L873DRAFT_1810682 [Choiromyces venosus 120613-1]